MAFWYSVGALVYFLVAVLGGWPNVPARGASMSATIAAHLMLMLFSACLWPLFLLLDVLGGVRAARR